MFSSPRFVALLSVLALGSTTSIAQELVLQWGFDEPGGGTAPALDTGATAPPAAGTFFGEATRSTDTPGPDTGFSLDFSTATGGDDFVNGGAPDKVDALTSFTFSTWIKMVDAPTATGGSNNVRLLAKQTEGPTFDGFSWNINTPNDTEDGGTDVVPDDFRMGLFVGGEFGFGFAQATADVEGLGAEWVFLAVTYDGTKIDQDVNFYFGTENDPVVQLGDTLDIGVGGLFPSNGTAIEADFGVGFTDAAPDGDFSLPGLQDDIRVWDFVLDASELDAARLENLAGDPGLAGDYTGDGLVDAADYTVWRDTLGDSVEAGAGADGNGNGVIDGPPADGNDYAIWASNFGAAGAVSIPEPASVLGALTALAACLRVRTR